jgi:CheY-like chemotaxis protein
VGIPADKLDHVFGVFQQLDGTTSRKYGGSGLGLAISRRLVELMGGRIVATSTPGVGSCFSVLLPITTVVAAAVPTPPASHTSPVPAAAQARTGNSAVTTSAFGYVLVVEDDKRLVKILERLIDTLGYSVTCVDSGEAALAAVAHAQPIGILLDLGLPGMTGMEVLGRLKADPLNTRIPVFIMSGANDTGEAKTLGAVGFLKKPVTREMIGAALNAMQQLSAQSASRQVLVVEDDKATVTALNQLFAGDPLALIPVASGQGAIDLLAARHFDAVILDLSLEDMSGFEFLDQICTPGQKHPPVVIYSARELTREELLSLRSCTETIIIKGRHANERLREEVLLALNTRPVAAVAVAEDGEKALEVLRAGRFDLMLTDIMMPGIDGYELIRRIRALGYSKLPIVAVTAKAMQGDRELCLKAGANGYIAKPVDVERLIELLRELL